MRLFFSYLILCFAVGSAGVVYAQENGDRPATTTTPDETFNSKKIREEMDTRFLELERHVLDQNALMLRRTEQVEARIDTSQRQIDTILLIFALVLLLGFFFISNNLRIRQRWAIDRINHATHNAESLMKDIQHEINRPELEYLRISQLLRRLMRQLRSPDPTSLPSSAHYIGEVRAACNDPYLPASLHFIARILTAEHDGNWNIAVQMLDQLRDMDCNDPDVLLHLSHVHKNIAIRTSDTNVRNRHQRLSYQYYTRFTATMNTQQMQSDMETPEDKVSPPFKALPREEKLATPTAPTNGQTIPEAAGDIPVPVAKKPAVVQTPPPATPAASATLITPVKQAEQKAIIPTITPPKAVTSQPVPPPETNEAVTKQTPALSTTPPPAAKATPSNTNATPSNTNPLKNINLSGMASTTKSIAALSGGGLSKIGSGLRSMAQILKEPNDEPLPPLPAPIVSEIPSGVDGTMLAMWKEIKNGDTAMERAATAKNLRKRNRIIDAAMAAYARAQAHKTNKTLYHNWGIALLAKALHVERKKRALFYNAAVDKFLAGNVVEPHYFDFHLASLHAIIGNKEECLKWLNEAKKSGSLDIESLMQAPDFDGVRSEPWFDKFLEN